MRAPDGPAGQQVGQDVERVVEARAALAQGHPGGGELLRELAAHAHPEHEPPAGQPVDRHELLGRPRDGPQAEQQDAQPERDPLRGHGGGRQARRRVERGRRRGQVVPGPDGVEAQVLREARGLGHARRAAAAQRVEGGQQDATADHASSDASAPGPAQASTTARR